MRGGAGGSALTAALAAILGVSMVWGQDYEASSSATHTLVGDFFSAREVPFVLLFPCSHRGSVTWLALGSTEPELDLAVDSDFTLASELAGGEVELRSLFKHGHHPGSPWDHLLLHQPLLFQLHQIAVGDDQAALRRALVDHTNTHMDTETRFGFALATHLAEMYNFTLRLLVTPSWGYPRGNGTFDGMIGMLQRGEIDLGVTPAVITKERLAVADFTVQTWTLR
ncbi:Ionotropic receptor 75c, partial [Frankliniella occidentalis]